MWPKHDDEMDARKAVRAALVAAFDSYRRQQHAANTWKVREVPDALLDSLTAAAVTAVIDRADELRQQESERIRPRLEELARKSEAAVAELLAERKIVLG